MLLAWDNKADDAALTTGSELASLPASNVQQPHLSRKWHTAAGVKSAYLILDLGASLACNLLAVLGTNLTSSATIRVRASNSDSTVTSSLLLDTGSVAAGVTDGYGAIYKSLASTTARYWRLDLADSTVASNLQIGRVFLGPSWTPAVNMQLGKAVMVKDDSPRARSYGKQTYIEELPQTRMLAFTLDYLTEAQMMGNAFALARANGLVRDVLAIPDISGSYLSQESVWGLLEAAEPIVNDKLGLFRQKFTIEERL